MNYENIITLQLNKECANIGLEQFKSQYRKNKEMLSCIEEEYRNKIITMDEVRRKREFMKKSLQQAVLDIHTSSISQGQGKDKRWYTPIKKGDRRIILKKPTYEELLEALVEFYGMDMDNKKKYTLRSLYPIWVGSMLKQGRSPGYIRRIATDWNTFYTNDAIVDVELKNLTINTIRDWLATQITKYQMTSKKFYNMQTIFKQIFQYAYEEEIILKNPFEKISFSKRIFFKGEASKTKRVESKQEVFTEEQIKMIKQIAMDAYMENPHFTTATAPLGILLLFQTGLRVGELVALKESNIFDDYLYVDCEEQRNYRIIIDEKSQEVKCVYEGTMVGNAKTDASYRQIPLTNEAKDIIELIRKTNKENGFQVEDYLFVNATQRMQENTILKHLYKYCKQASIEKRSPHKIRKTFASILVNSGSMDISEVASLMGHVSESTLINHYLYSTKNKDTRLERMEQCLAI